MQGPSLALRVGQHHRTVMHRDVVTAPAPQVELRIAQIRHQLPFDRTHEHQVLADLVGQWSHPARPDLRLRRSQHHRRCVGAGKRFAWRLYPEALDAPIHKVAAKPAAISRQLERHLSTSMLHRDIGASHRCTPRLPAPIDSKRAARRRSEYGDIAPQPDEPVCRRRCRRSEQGQRKQAKQHAENPCQPTTHRLAPEDREPTSGTTSPDAGCLSPGFRSCTY